LLYKDIILFPKFLYFLFYENITTITLTIFYIFFMFQENLLELLCGPPQRTSIPQCLKVILNEIVDGSSICKFYTMCGSVDKSAFIRTEMSTTIDSKLFEYYLLNFNRTLLRVYSIFYSSKYDLENDECSLSKFLQNQTRL